MNSCAGQQQGLQIAQAAKIEVTVVSSLPGYRNKAEHACYRHAAACDLAKLRGMAPLKEVLDNASALANVIPPELPHAGNVPAACSILLSACRTC